MSNLVKLDNKLTSTKVKVMSNSNSKKDVILVIDWSGSMYGQLENGQYKYKVVLDQIQKFGHIKKLYFESNVYWDKHPYECPGGSTDLALAINTAKEFTKKMLIITDGEPNNRNEALKAAKGTHIDVIYIGTDDNEDAKDFLSKLAGGKGGVFKDIDPLLLEENIKEILMLKEGKTNDGTINL